MTKTHPFDPERGISEAEALDVARYYSARMSDGAIEIANLVSRAKWDRLADALTTHSHTTQVLAGIVAQYLLRSRSPDAPEQCHKLVNWAHLPEAPE